MALRSTDKISEHRMGLGSSGTKKKVFQKSLSARRIFRVRGIQHVRRVPPARTYEGEIHSVITGSSKINSKSVSPTDARIESASKIEKFTETDLENLRKQLMQAGIDSWQAADVLSGFLTGRGYGVSTQRARDAIARLEGTERDLDSMQLELERVAFVM
jgi:hypothetical protein